MESVSGTGPGSVVQAVLQALKLLVTCPMSRQEKSRGAWRNLLRSALSTLLGLWEPGRDGPVSGADGKLGRPVFPGDRLVDQASLLTALAVFLESAGAEVCGPEPLHTACLQRFVTAMEAKDPLVRTSRTGPSESLGMSQSVEKGLDGTEVLLLQGLILCIIHVALWLLYHLLDGTTGS